MRLAFRTGDVLRVAGTALVCAAAVSACMPGGGRLPPEEVIERSVQEFQQTTSYEAVFEIEYDDSGKAVRLEGGYGYDNDELVYSRSVVEPLVASNEFIEEYLLIADDLYLRRGNGGWYVQSPWSQGIRPDELADYDVEASVFQYDDLPEEFAVEELEDEEIEGNEYWHYKMEFEPDSEGAKPEARTENDIWLDGDTYLPFRVEVEGTSVGPPETSVMLLYEFSNFGGVVTGPDRPDALPYRDLAFPEAPCTGDEFTGCLEAQAELAPLASEACAGSGRRICMVPLGQIDPGLVERLMAHYEEQYDLTIALLPPTTIPEEMFDPLRQQVDAWSVVDYKGSILRPTTTPMSCLWALLPWICTTTPATSDMSSGSKGARTPCSRHSE